MSNKEFAAILIVSQLAIAIMAVWYFRPVIVAAQEQLQQLQGKDEIYDEEGQRNV